MKFNMLATALAAAGVAVAGFAQETATTQPAKSFGGRQDAALQGDFDDETFFEKWIKGHLSIGVNVSKFTFTDNERPADINREKNYIGAVNRLEEEDDVTIYPVVNYWVSDYARIGLTYDKITARTYNFNNNLSDGNAVYEGPMLSLEGAYPFFEGLLVPHLGGGVAFYSGDFEEDTWWHLAYGSPQSWESHGRRNSSATGYYREIHVKNETVFYLTCGVATMPLDNLVIDLAYRSMSLDPDCSWGHQFPSGRYEKHRDGDLDLSHYAISISASYLF